MRDPLGEGLRDKILVNAVASCQDLRGIRFGKEEVDEIKEAILDVIVSHGDESYGDTGGDTDSILDVEVLGVDISGWLE